jgi:RNA polymerase sigma factor (sigma-70 family)
MAATQPFIEDLLVGVYQDQKPRLWGYFLRGAESEQVAEDLLQELFLRLWDHRDRLASELGPGDCESLRRYLWRTARNLMIDEIRAMQKDRAVKPSEGDVSTNHHTVVEREDCLRVVRETVVRLKNDRARRCMRLWLDGKELTQIADEARISIGQVRGLIQRARAEVILRAGNLLRSMAERGRET